MMLCEAGTSVLFLNTRTWPIDVVVVFYQTIRKDLVGSGSGSVGRAVASDTRGPWFESSHRQYLY